jgi:hypothetical protein
VTFVTIRISKNLQLYISEIHTFVSMRRNISHILLSLVLTLAVSDYIWVEIFEDQHLVVELETEKEPIEESLRADKADSESLQFVNLRCCEIFNSFENQTISSGFLKHGNSFSQQYLSSPPKLFIRHHQLQLNC